MDGMNKCKFTQLWHTAEVCRIRSTGVDSGRSWRCSAGARAGPGMDIFDWNRSRSRSDF